MKLDRKISINLIVPFRALVQRQNSRESLEVVPKTAVGRILAWILAVLFPKPNWNFLSTYKSHDALGCAINPESQNCSIDHEHIEIL